VTILESYGYRVIDLGKNVDQKDIIKAAIKEKPLVICLSALMTTTMIHMPEVIKALKKNKITIPVMIGGAVVTDEYAKEIGAHYSKDAHSAVNKVKEVLKCLEQ